jgi:hypothetical protein
MEIEENKYSNASLSYNTWLCSAKRRVVVVVDDDDDDDDDNDRDAERRILMI